MSYEQAKALLDKSVSRPTLYSVRVPRVDRSTNDYINFFCSATSIPEVRVDTIIAAGHENMGIVREQPTAVMFGKPFTMTIIENSDFLVYKEIRNWFDLTTQNANQLGGLTGRAGGRSQRMNYYDTYVSDFELVKLEQKDNPVGTEGSLDPNANYKKPLTVKFLNAYPVSISDISLSSEAFDSYTEFSVSFNYESDNLTGRVVGAFSKSNNISGQNTYSTALRQQGNDSDVDDSNGVRGFINTGLGNWNDFSYGITLPEGGFGLVGDGKFNSSGTNVTLQTAAQRLRCDDINNQCPRDENGHIIYNEERGPGRVLLGVGGTSTAAERTYNSIGTDWEYNVYDMGPITSFKAGATYIREEAISAKAENSALGIPLTGYAELAEQLFVPNSSEEGNGFFGRDIDVEVANNVTLDADVLLDFILKMNLKMRQKNLFLLLCVQT